MAVQLVYFEDLEEDLGRERHWRAREVLQDHQFVVRYQVQVDFLEVRYRVNRVAWFR